MNPYLAKIAALSNGKALALGLVVTLFYYQMIYDDGEKYRKQIDAQGKELAVEREKEGETDRAIARRNQLKESFEALAEQYKIVSKQIPADLDSALVVKTVDTMAKTSGITVKSKEPRTAVREEILEVYPIRVTAEGGYSELTMFFYNLSTSEHVFRVRNFTFQGPDEKKGSGARKLSMDAEIASFRFIGVDDTKNAKDPSKAKTGGGK